MTPPATFGSGSGRPRDAVGRPVGACVAACAALAALAVPLVAQESSSSGGNGATADSVAPVPPDSAVEYAREVFSYPGQGRRNPFAPVSAGVAQGPRFRNLQLRGVIYSPSVGSVAVLLDETTGKRYRVRDGQRIGDARVLRIGRSAVTFAVSTVGQTRRETLQVEKQERESQG